MSIVYQKLPFLLELFFNGSFILLYSLSNSKSLPESWNRDFVESILNYGSFFVPIVLMIVVASNFFVSKNIESFMRKYVFSLIVFIPILITWGDLEFSVWLSSAHLLSSVLSLYDEDTFKRVSFEEVVKNPFLKNFKFTPAQTVLFSFAAVIFIGTFLLMLPVSSVGANKSIGFIDAFFMATSATCVTGLSSISLGQDFSLFGQLVVLVLIQIGGLSIMTLYAASITILLGRNMGVKNKMVMQDVLDVNNLEELFALMVSIVKYTIVIELWGAIVLAIAFTFEGFEFGQALYYGFYHSISAFCNAGFSLFDTSLESYGTNPLIHGTIAILITLGGVGFLVLKEIRVIAGEGFKLKRLSLHSKIVLITSLILTLGGAVFIFFGEFLNALDAYTFWEKIQLSLFQSITLRTAGFNSLPLTELHTYTIYAMTLFMFIGGSPGSTAGGVKTTTLAILIQSIVSTLKGQNSVNIFDRKIPSSIVVKVTALTFISILFTSFFILLLMKIEPNQSFLTIFFEVISASGTVGLSLGITSELSVLGKVALSFLMLIGRIGPLTLILAIGQQVDDSGKFDYPDGKIMIG